MPRKLEQAKENAARIHAADPDMILDEITWFSQQPEAYRNDWLRYAWKWVREHDSAAYVQMPGFRCLAGARSHS